MRTGPGREMDGVFIVDEIGLGVVLTLCTHGIRFRSDEALSQGESRRKAGELAKLVVVVLES